MRDHQQARAPGKEAAKHAHLGHRGVRGRVEIVNDNQRGQCGCAIEPGVDLVDAPTGR